MMLLSVLVCCLVTYPLAVQGQVPTTVRVTGIIEAYDATTHTLSVTTSSGVTRFTLERSVRVRRQRRAIDSSELSNWIGCRASVRYLDEPGARVVESVRIADCSHRARPAGQD